MKKLREKIIDNIKDNFDLYIICCIPVFPFCLAANTMAYISFVGEHDIGGLESCMLLLCIVLLLICMAVFHYALTTYIRQNAEKYNILLMLGMSNRDFWKNLMKEYCSAFLLLVLSTSLISTILCNLALSIILHIFSKVMIIHSLWIMVALVMLQCIGIVVMLLFLRLKQWRTDLAQYFEKISIGTEKVHRFRLSYGGKAFLAIFSITFSFGLLHEYTVGKCMIAILLHLTGIYYLLQMNGRVIKRVAGKLQGWYFRKLLFWNDFIFEYRMNGKVIYSIYAISFLLTFLFGGLFVSDFPKENEYLLIKIIFASIGLTLILEEYAIVLEKMVLDSKNERERYYILFQIGLNESEYRWLIRRKVKSITILPGVIASIAGAVFFLRDYIFQETIVKTQELWNITLWKYFGFIFAFYMIQYSGYLFVQKKLLGVHYVFGKAIKSEEAKNGIG